jgi:N-acetylglucosamine-6-sulfatase
MVLIANRGESLVTFLYSARSRGVLEMKKIVLPLASVALVVLLSLGLSGSMPTHAEALTAKPNIVFILADDMRKDDLKYMPKTRNLLQEKGMTFQNAFVSNALCCPSRATIMRGQYSHNTGVWTNHNSTGGGWQAYKTNDDENDNVATRLHDAGYRTALIGKYLNGYHDTTYVPPGWDRWFATFDGTGGSFRYFDYDINDNGTIRHYGTRERDYKTDVLSRKTNAFISNSASLGKPFFAYVTPIAPHLPSKPAPRDAHTFDGLNAPRLPSFNERNVSDKPSWIRKLPRLTSDQITNIDNLHEYRIESLQAVDDLVQGVVGKLKNAGVMSNTYIFFTSDNGWYHGEHRIPNEKSRPYEEDVHMPLVVRGPGVAADSTTSKLALNTDYLPTFTNLAGAQSPPYVDGRSLRPVLKGNATTWRNAILLEGAAYPSPAYRGIRTVSTSTTKRKYVEYAGGAREFYKLDPDPYELTNRYNAAKPPSGLASRLQALKTCSADTCRTAEDGQ